MNESSKREKQDVQGETFESSLEHWIYASGSDAEKVRELYGKLSALIPRELPHDPSEAAEEINNVLQDSQVGGFEYEDKIIKIEEVLEKRRGNCASLPLLLGLLLKERGIPFDLSLCVNPKDPAYEEEKNILRDTERAIQESLNEYGSVPSLPEGSEEVRLIRAYPMEHMLLSFKQPDGELLLDPTIEDGELFHTEDFSSEFRTEIDFIKGASLIMRERAAIKKLSSEERKKLLLESLSLWPENRESYAALMAIAVSEFDDAVFESSKEAYKNASKDNQDSRYFYTMALWEESDEKALEYIKKALKLYKTFGDARAFKARLLSKEYEDILKEYGENDTRAKQALRKTQVEFLVAAIIHTHSMHLSYNSFLIENAISLAKVFDKEEIYNALLAIPESERDMEYHMALVALRNSEADLLMARKKMGDSPSPLKEMHWLLEAQRLDKINGKSYYDATRAMKLYEAHLQSTTFREMRERWKDQGWSLR